MTVAVSVMDVSYVCKGVPQYESFGALVLPEWMLWEWMQSKTQGDNLKVTGRRLSIMVVCVLCKVFVRPSYHTSTLSPVLPVPAKN